MPSRSLFARLKPRRIALLKPSALGDIVHALPLLPALRARFPEAQLSWVVNRVYEPLLRGHPDLDSLIPFDRGMFRRGWWSALRGGASFWHRLRQERFDLVLDLQGLLRTGLMALASGARFRLGLPGAREGSRYCYSHIVPGPAAKSAHAVDRYWSVAEAFGVGDLPKIFRLPTSADADAWAERTLAGMPRPLLMTAVGSRWRTKCWPPAHFAALLNRAGAEFGGSVVLVGVPDDRPATDEVCAALHGTSLDLVGKTTLPQLTAVLRRADLMLANDTGPLHLAAALGRPTIAPYTCTTIPRHGPYGFFRGAVAASVPCAGSYLKHCATMICMSDLTPAKLWPPLQEILTTWAATCRSA